jgi:hypothetical protein
MATEMARWLVFIAVGCFPENPTNPEALGYLEQARQVLKESKLEGNRSDRALQEIGLGYASAGADADTWKTIEKIWQAEFRNETSMQAMPFLTRGKLR